MSDGKYKMTISRMTIDKLGVKLYDKVSAVIAELVANGYDADATRVTVEAPMGKYLATTSQGHVNDAGYKMVVADDGCGMVPEVINTHYLTVGGERRKDPQRGNKSSKYGRLVMGRKGVGKLAPFGICSTIEIITSGGEVVEGSDENGNPSQGYRTAHFVMQRDDILSDTDKEYEPEVGYLDGLVTKRSGTRIVMSNFINRKVPDAETFSRQLAQRFGVKSDHWQIRLIDSNPSLDESSRNMEVGEFQISTMEGTRIAFNGPASEVLDPSRRDAFNVKDEYGKDVPGVEAGFLHTDGRFYPIVGWIAYAKEPYRDELMAGVRIYCRGKIAAQTRIFNRKAGFTGEYNIRSYLVGEIHADWLDEDDDLIQTDRRDILWSDDRGQALENWGHGIITLIGNRSREPLKRNIWEQFQEAGNVLKRIRDAYPGDRWKAVRERTEGMARLLGQKLRLEEVQDTEHVNDLVELCLMLGPHVEVSESLRSAANEADSSIGVMTSILRTARVAELSSYGLIAERRVEVIERISGLLDAPNVNEQQLQNVLAEAPWLINPLWSPITANRSLSTLKKAFEKHYFKKTGRKISLQSFIDSKKRPDFVLSSDDYGLQIIEIKGPGHTLSNNEWDRVQTYIEQMAEFLDMPGNTELVGLFRKFTTTLVCDNVDGLTGAQRKAFESYKKDNEVEHMSWASFLSRTRKMHEEFLKEAERQRQLEIK